MLSDNHKQQHVEVYQNFYSILKMKELNFLLLAIGDKIYISYTNSESQQTNSANSCNGSIAPKTTNFKQALSVGKIVPVFWNQKEMMLTDLLEHKVMIKTLSVL